MPPRVLVLGIDTPIGLAIVRELGRNGVQVHGIARSRDSLGLHSRRLARGYEHGPRDDALVALMNRIGAESGVEHLMTVSESDILFCNERREELRRFRFLFADADRMRRVLDKDLSVRLAREVGLSVPETHVPAHAGDVPDGVRYPVVLKWGDPNRVASRLHEQGIELRKAEYCYDRDELLAALRRYEPVGVYPLVQRFCPGRGLGHMVFMHEGRPLLRFQHRRLHEWPPEGGFSTLCESEAADALPDLMERSVELLRRMDWQGAAMVEYRYDTASGEAVFMEVNGRFWGSLPLAYHAGAPFAWLTYAVLGLGRVPDAPPYRAGVRCMYGLPELKRLLVILFRQKRIQDRELRFGRWRALREYVGCLLSPRCRFYVFTWSDPRPFLADCLAIARKILRRLLRR